MSVCLVQIFLMPFKLLVSLSPCQLHMFAVLRIIRYLCRPLTCGLFFPSGSFSFVAFVMLIGVVPDTRQSTTGWCVFLVILLFHGSVKKQPTVSKSSTEAEYRPCPLSVVKSSGSTAYLMILVYLVPLLLLSMQITNCYPYCFQPCLS